MRQNEKKTAPESLVGASGEQSSVKSTHKSILDKPDKIKENCKKDCEISERSGETIAEIVRAAPQLLSPHHTRLLPTVTMSELYEQVFQARPPVMEGLLYPGTYLFVGAPKLGKSFLVMQFAYHVAAGLPLWGYPVRKGTVLYLALEDEQRRLQDRLYRMFGTECTEQLHLAVSASQLNEGLVEQLESFVRNHSDTALIIIDTLQKIREAGDERYSYANDYDVITQLKAFTDKTGVCLLLVHHTRKQQADDRFEMISGTNGLLGAADGAFLLHKKKRTSCAAVLDVSGRDQPDQTLYLNRNPETLTWDLEKTESETFEARPEPVLEAVAGLITPKHPEWTGRASELVEMLDLSMNPNTLTMKLNVNAAHLLNEYGIRYENKRNHDGRQVSFRYVKEAVKDTL